MLGLSADTHVHHSISDGENAAGSTAEENRVMFSATFLGEQSRNKAGGGHVVVDGSQDCDLDAVLLPDRPRKVDHACVYHTSGMRLRVL
jgi:hypothetical protein